MLFSPARASTRRSLSLRAIPPCRVPLLDEGCSRGVVYRRPRGLQRSRRMSLHLVASKSIAFGDCNRGPEVPSHRECLTGGAACTRGNSRQHIDGNATIRGERQSDIGNTTVADNPRAPRLYDWERHDESACGALSSGRPSCPVEQHIDNDGGTSNQRGPIEHKFDDESAIGGASPIGGVSFQSRTAEASCCRGVAEASRCRCHCQFCGIRVRSGTAETCRCRHASQCYLPRTFRGRHGRRIWRWIV